MSELENITGQKRKRDDESEEVGEPPKKKQTLEEKIERVKLMEKQFVREISDNGHINFVEFEALDVYDTNVKFDDATILKSHCEHNEVIKNIRAIMKETSEFVKEKLPYIMAGGMSFIPTGTHIREELARAQHFINSNRKNVSCGLCGEKMSDLFPLWAIAKQFVTFNDSIRKLLCTKCKKTMSCERWKTLILGEKM